MSTREIEDYEQQIYNRLDTFDSPPPPPPPEPIYDLTTSDKTELVKAAGPIERGENPQPLQVWRQDVALKMVLVIDIGNHIKYYF